MKSSAEAAHGGSFTSPSFTPLCIVPSRSAFAFVRNSAQWKNSGVSSFTSDIDVMHMSHVCAIESN